MEFKALKKDVLIYCTVEHILRLFAEAVQLVVRVGQGVRVCCVWLKECELPVNQDRHHINKS